MATNEYTPVEHLELARSRVTEQLKDKQTFDRYLQLLVKNHAEFELVLQQLMQLRSIDTAEGVNLDNIGEIVGQPRELLEADLYEYFGFQGAVNAQSMGEFGNVQVGGQFYNYGDPFGGNILLDDATYRSFIKAKIFKNTAASTPEEFIRVINAIFNTSVSALIAEGDASVTLLFGRQLTNFERALLNYVSTSQGYPSRLIPKTIGVRINYGEFLDQGYFGFQGSPGAKGFGELRGDYGYGLGYGLNYGESNYTQDYNSNGGVFASIYMN